MSEHGDLPPMRPVDADDAIPETRWWQSPKRVMIQLGLLIVVWALVSVARDVLHVPFRVLIAVGAVATVVSVAVDVVRWRRRRRS